MSNSDIFSRIVAYLEPYVTFIFRILAYLEPEIYSELFQARNILAYSERYETLAYWEPG